MATVTRPTPCQHIRDDARIETTFVVWAGNDLYFGLCQICTDVLRNSFYESIITNFATEVGRQVARQSRLSSTR